MFARVSQIAAALAVATALVTPAAARDKLIINSYGGAYEQIHRKLVIEPFMKKYDVDVQVVTAYSADALAQVRAQKASPQFDVIHFSGGQEVVAAREQPSPALRDSLPLILEQLAEALEEPSPADGYNSVPKGPVAADPRKVVSSSGFAFVSRAPSRARGRPVVRAPDLNPPRVGGVRCRR